ncbi:hypothetical protein NY035_02940 [Corynebacterium diphtheriae bv. mitis]|uniref:hypothetical protein n=1 Tax=Corynebacterium diphtheriae TaxID=1717 RepID=UPI000245B52C|nr:hypothetical protein [Corynebacterium diphtheriae]AEX45813.1 hypothetical protein CDB402_0502 [Corynebacterium diphtheriae INCA 402]MBG9221069.1 hypothetical protein [Corynebacterium diphtheriae bv. mitis]MBG9277454.1 hypothetical protein [Corynebacterium diphtheriae bv. mitis]MBG9281936.1 hypothetical protein [Corynebacterium diphtheriae bv. mitis]MBG9294064.1 hypothetical protein [Corynebacterium diphtheriae bv. mitis]
MIERPEGIRVSACTTRMAVGCTLRIIDVTPQTTNAKKRKRAAKTTSPTPRHWCF